MEAVGIDIPEPLTPEQLNVLRMEHSKLRRRAVAATRDVNFFVRRKQHLENQLKRCDADILAVQQGTAPEDDTVRSADPASPTTANGEAKGEEDAAVGAAPAPQERTKRSRDEDAAPSENKAPVRRRPQLARGALFQRVAGHLAAAQKDEARIAALNAKRQEALRSARLAQLQQSRAGVAEQYEEVAEKLRTAEMIHEEVTPQFEELNKTWKEMRLMEAAYSDAFFLKAKGPAFDLCFAPVAHTAASRAVLQAQLTAAAAEYAPYRSAVNAVLLSAAENPDDELLDDSSLGLGLGVDLAAGFPEMLGDGAAEVGEDAAVAAAPAEPDSHDLALPAAELDDDVLDF